MRPQLAILFLTALLPFLCVDASQVAQVDNRLEVYFDYDAWDDLWTEIVSLLNPANIAEKIQKALFVSNLLGMPSMANADGIQVSPNSLDLAPEFLQRSLETLFSEETGTLSRFFETVINGTVALRVALHDLLELTSADSVLSSDAPLAPVLGTVATFVAIVRDDFRARFTLPAMAPGHAKREKHVSDALEYLQQLAIRPAKSHGEVIERHLARAKPLLHNVGVLIGDVAELYPEAIEAVLSVGAVLWPEAVLVRSLVILYCFGPYVLGKDVIGGWLVSETSRIWQMQVVLRS
ncbi:hypothetical protein JVT61DRAFT_3364 [Boletus reticuloceps]|uniref:Uncharacterized protein n=1 Tax=Boletus reticuloceps TaxID=495285 RepID=A0A8I2YML9_9AGAM|nr:hypothetical protein JVT61DRAFT_3604 [Boletus reticuloceps]KAG6375157.1 hypothetical protein JVT61DRAFT_3364 [Boletus reticuloceps]